MLTPPPPSWAFEGLWWALLPAVSLDDKGWALGDVLRSLSTLPDSQGFCLTNYFLNFHQMTGEGFLAR